MANIVQRARIDLAAALRLAARLDVSEGGCNHFSYQLAGEEERFLINPHHPLVADAHQRLASGRQRGQCAGGRTPVGNHALLRSFRGPPQASACLLRASYPHGLGHDNIRTFAADYAVKRFEALKQVLEGEDPGYRDRLVRRSITAA